MVNPTSKNGYGVKNCLICFKDPPDDVLHETLKGYVARGLKPKEKLQNLCLDHKLDIHQSRLQELEQDLGVRTVRQNDTPAEELTQASIDKVNKDIGEKNSANYFKTQLQWQNIMVKRDEIHKVMHHFHPSGFDVQFPGGTKACIPRTALEAFGPFHQVSSDDHEKFGASALEMANVIPDCQSMGAVGHLFLYFIEEFDAIPLQNITHKGSEVGWIEAPQIALRELLAPQIDPETFPPYVAVKSTHNTVIKAIWHWF
ncbi:hypothetical protein GYMLUDRAFT_62880 [Collybiopsis luxurians FD-317 M1]|uniref:Uncharacterized protein n=1 Tax=Collybiopsis luxurians FD-317 M1 TaxID=944289 RepID=A0A0D0AWM6_9AGAR|nr:hypothetical protein GYMLUDRAFT_62880 [Collybiopsis luxurians FD-317 M1]